MLTQHLTLYVQDVHRVNAIEAAYPMTDWAPLEALASNAIAGTILDSKVGDLDLSIQGALAQCLREVVSNLAAHGISWAPTYYLGDGDFWTTNLGVSVNVPWFLANATLWRLANQQASTAYTATDVTKVLRHETAHALLYAFRIFENPRWEAAFGPFNAPYLDAYPTNRTATDFVEYLNNVSNHYGQKHPDEDWAETFAAWLDPTVNWREQYKQWPKALAKLELVGELIASLVVGQPPKTTNPGRPNFYMGISSTVGEELGTSAGRQPYKQIKGWSEYSELLRREPHAYNSVVLHELFFEGLGARTEAPLTMLSLVEATWGSWASYTMELRAMMETANPGWATTVWDPRRGALRNALIEGHGSGIPIGCTPILALDAWEHAYAADYGVRKDAYIAALFQNIDWARAASLLPLTPLEVLP